MISCTEFIPAYSELFKYLERKGGKQAVFKYWEYLSDTGLGNLREEVKKNGLEGCFNYWSRTLNEEAADFTMTLNADKSEFIIEMHHCPSKGRLVEYKQMEPYYNYCMHCDVLYRRVLEPMGYEFSIDLSKCANAECSLTLRKKKNDE